jgi:prepilin-type N-terminal cleavage/methylation domain-containing protein
MNRSNHLHRFPRRFRAPRRLRARTKPAAFDKQGFTLLEIILALAILAGSLTALGEVMRLADQMASLTEGESQAQILAASVMDELQSGARQLETVRQASLASDAEPPWLYSIETDKTNLDAIISVRITVEQKLDPRLQPARFDLTRYMPNPDYTAPNANTQSNSSSSSSTSSTSSSSSSGSSSKSGGGSTK